MSMQHNCGELEIMGSVWKHSSIPSLLWGCVTLIHRGQSIQLAKSRLLHKARNACVLLNSIRFFLDISCSSFKIQLRYVPIQDTSSDNTRQSQTILCSVTMPATSL